MNSMGSWRREMSSKGNFACLPGRVCERVAESLGIEPLENLLKHCLSLVSFINMLASLV